MTAEPALPSLAWRGTFTNDELNGLQAECFGSPLPNNDWNRRVHQHSLGWVCMRHTAVLTGFVNVAWDGGVHAFLLDTMVTPALRRRGLATLLVEEAARRAHQADCEWLHVDFEPSLKRFYLDGCGFTPTEAGLIRLR